MMNRAQPERSVPLERRREMWRVTSSNWSPSPTPRREGDFVRMRLQHWIDLADAALSQDWQAERTAQHPGPRSNGVKKAA